MSTLLRARWSPRSARALPVLLLALLWALLLPGLAQGATSYQVLHPFPLSPQPQPLPVTPSGLLLGADGNFYGTIYFGGANDRGAVFQMTPTGAFSLFYSFPAAGADGANPPPSAGLIQDGAGSFYGMTYYGGLDDLGTIFKLPVTGTPTGTPTLHAFTIVGAGGAYPAAGLLRDAAGNLYGTTSEKGTQGYGTVFKLTWNEGAGTFTFTPLYSFNGSDGENPLGGLVRDLAGNLYGTTSSGGTSTSGTIFKLTPTGSLSTLHPFSGKPDGANPQGNLLLDAGGNILYGTTYAGGGTPELGTVFRLSDIAGTPTLTILHEFTGTDGAYPSAGLLLGSDGNLYGTTFGSCTYGDTCTSGYGTVFRLAPDGSAFTTLHVFDGVKGANPQTPVIQGSDGHFYGTTSRGGSTTGGVAFVLRVGNALTVSIEPAGTGTVTSDPPGINCPGTCTEVFAPTLSVTLTATPAADAIFTGWSEPCTDTDPCIVAMTEARSVTATFAPQNLELRVNKAGPGAGTVTSTPAGLSCVGNACSGTFAYNTIVTLTATPATGSTFTGWDGDSDCSDGRVTMTVNPTTCTATFQDPTFPEVTHTPVTSWKENTALPITATITDNIAVQGATLFYRTAGAGTFSSLPMTGTGPTYSRSIPAGTVVRPAGVEYYLEASDAAGNVRRRPSAPGTYQVVVGTSTFTDDPLGAGATTIKVIHFTELLTAINAVRTKAPYNLTAFVWTGTAPAAGGAVRASHLADLRTALDQAYAAAVPPKTHAPYTDPTLTTGGTTIKAIHLNELRTFERALE
ncbi:MAG TPA: choice-of-anchor tandem repeat GloVer-containing protein [Candidatus Methylomirabilis sp.]|nr:choice-of-anchor tandem repeat GloVer-containing protein [Candidatus Methylomirabilis sp.]